MKSTHQAVSRILLAILLGAGGLAVTGLSLAGEQPAGDVGRGAKAWADNCTRCHNVRDPQELRDDQWKTSIFHMRIRAGLTGQETRDIITFMQNSN